MRLGREEGTTKHDADEDEELFTPPASTLCSEEEVAVQLTGFNKPLKRPCFPTMNYVALELPWLKKHCPKGMPCTQCAHSAKFCMSANTRTLVLVPWGST